MKRKDLEAVVAAQAREIERLTRQVTSLDATLRMVNNHCNDLERRMQERVGTLEGQMLSLERQWAERPAYWSYYPVDPYVTTTMTSTAVSPGTVGNVMYTLTVEEDQ